MAHSAARFISTDAPVTAKFWSKLRESAKNKAGRVIRSGQGPPAREHTSRSVQKARCLSFCSSHYRGFAVDPRRLEKAAQDAIEKWGPAGSRLSHLGGHLRPAMHVKLDSEERIARFKGTEGSVTFTSAYAAPQRNPRLRGTGSASCQPE